MKYAQQKRGGRTAIFAGTCADEPVPTVCFDLSDSAGRELPATSQSTPMSFSLSAPSLEEHYGALLQREEQAHQRTEEKLRMAQEQMRRMQDDLQKRELEFEEDCALPLHRVHSVCLKESLSSSRMLLHPEIAPVFRVKVVGSAITLQEKKELMDMIDEKEEILAFAVCISVARQSDIKRLADIAMFLQLTLAVLVQGVAGQLCPLVPIMPDTFIFRREMFTFWATETIYNGETFFSKVEQRPSILGKSFLPSQTATAVLFSKKE
eukprot:g32258.t3